MPKKIKFKEKTIHTLKLFIKLKKAVFGHIMDEILKNKEKMYIGFQWGMKFSLAPNLVLKLFIFFFLNTFKQSLLLLCVGFRV